MSAVIASGLPGEEVAEEARLVVLSGRLHADALPVTAVSQTDRTAPHSGRTVWTSGER